MNQSGPFHGALRRRPWAAFVLALCCAAAAVLVARGALGESVARTDNALRGQVLTVLWSAGGVYFGVWALLGWRDRRTEARARSR